MTNRLKLFPLLMLLPACMANSAKPTKKYTKNYDNVDIYVNYVGVDENRKTENNVCYEIEVKNVGSSHIAPVTTVPFRSDSESRIYYLDLEAINPIFSEQSIAPGQSAKYHTYVNDKFSFEQRFDAVFTTYIHEVEDCNFDGAVIKEDYKKANQYVLKVDNNKIPDTNMALFIDVTYKGEENSFYMYFNPKHRTFTTNEKLDLDQLTINKITAFEEQRKDTGNSCTTTNSTLWILLGIFFALILGAILTPVIITAVRRNRI